MADWALCVQEAPLARGENTSAERFWFLKSSTGLAIVFLSFSSVNHLLFVHKVRRFLEREVHRHGTMVGDPLRQAIIQITESSRKMRSKEIRSA